MPNLLDLMSEEDRVVALKNYQERMSGSTRYRSNASMSPKIYLISELGYHYGWGAIEAVKRGYVAATDDKSNTKKIPLTMEEVAVLVEGARKVWYGKVVDSARGSLAASASVMSKNPSSTFKKHMDIYAKNAELQTKPGDSHATKKVSNYTSYEYVYEGYFWEPRNSLLPGYATKQPNFIQLFDVITAHSCLHLLLIKRSIPCSFFCPAFIIFLFYLFVHNVP